MLIFFNSPDSCGGHNIKHDVCIHTKKMTSLKNNKKNPKIFYIRNVQKLNNNLHNNRKVKTKKGKKKSNFLEIKKAHNNFNEIYTKLYYYDYIDPIYLFLKNFFSSLLKVAYFHMHQHHTNISIHTFPELDGYKWAK